MKHQMKVSNQRDIKVELQAFIVSFYCKKQIKKDKEEHLKNQDSANVLIRQDNLRSVSKAKSKFRYININLLFVA